MFFIVREDILLIERKIDPIHIERGQSAKVHIAIERKTRFPFAYIVMEELVDSEGLVQAKIQNTNAIKFVGFKKL